MQVDFIAKSMTPAEAHLELYGKTELIANKVIEIEEEIDAISFAGARPMGIYQRCFGLRWQPWKVHTA